MKRSRKKYEKPVRPWDKERIEKEKEILKKYGLIRKKELWRMEAILRKYRRMARELAAKKDKEKEKTLVEKLTRLGLLQKGSSLDDVLGLALEPLLERRLQTILLKKGLVNSVKQARQIITHGHVTINNNKIVYPGYLVKVDEEDKITVNVPIQIKKVAEVESK